MEKNTLQELKESGELEATIPKKKTLEDRYVVCCTVVVIALHQIIAQLHLASRIRDRTPCGGKKVLHVVVVSILGICIVG